MKKVFLLFVLINLCALSLFAQEGTIKATGDIKVYTKQGAIAAVFIDGKKYDESIFELIDQSKIESVEVLRGEEALKKYNEPRVIVVTTKKNANKVDFKSNTVRIKGGILLYDNNTEDPLIFINGILRSEKELKTMSPDSIDNITVIKDAEAIKEYKSKTGVIIVTTKKSKSLSKTKQEE